MTQSKVPKSVEEVIKEIESFEKNVQKIGQKAFKEGEYIRTKVLIESATRMDTLKKSFNELGIELNEVFSDVETHLKEMPAGKTRRTTKRIPRGKKTPEAAYQEPILKALTVLGGKGTTSEVLDKVYGQMKNRLNEFDKQPVPSVPSQQRWRHTAQIVRNKMIKEGLVKKDSPRGIWEISNAGKKSVGTKAPTKKTSAKKKASPKKSSPAKKSSPKPKSSSKTTTPAKKSTTTEKTESKPDTKTESAK